MNSYSWTWVEIFLSDKGEDETRKEAKFILNQLDLSHHSRILDVACGLGRHSRHLAAHGFDITAIDIDEDIIKKARNLNPDIDFKLHDMREIKTLQGNFDVVIIMWQSFGYFDPQTNIDVLHQIFNKMSHSGILIIDLYNKAFFEQNQGVRQISRQGREITETKFVKNNRLTVHLEYHDNFDPDVFDWYIYTPEELTNTCEDVGFTTKLICKNFDPQQTEELNTPRIQYVFRK